MDKIDKYLTEKKDPELEFVKNLQQYLKDESIDIYHKFNNGANFNTVAKDIDRIKRDLDRFKRLMKKVPSGWVD